jgi:hypothetical protein
MNSHLHLTVQINTNVCVLSRQVIVVFNVPNPFALVINIQAFVFVLTIRYNGGLKF